LAPGGRTYTRLQKTIKGEPDYYGRKPSLAPEALRAVTGAYLTKGGPFTTGAAKFQKQETLRRTEARRPVREAYKQAIKSGDPDDMRDFNDLYEMLSPGDKDAVQKQLSQLETEAKAQYPAMEQMTNEMREEYEKRLREVGAKVTVPLKPGRVRLPTRQPRNPFPTRR
jgi:hypothetical protein